MASKKSTSRKSSGSSRQSNAKKTIGKIEDLGKQVVKNSLAQKDPFVDVPTRSISNTQFNKRRRILEMGGNSQRRNLFNLGQATKFMRTTRRCQMPLTALLRSRGSSRSSTCPPSPGIAHW